MKAALLIFVSLITAMSASANMECNAVGCIGVPHRVLAYANGIINIYPNAGHTPIGGDSGPLQCLGVDNNKAINLPTGEGQDRVYSTVLTAITTKQPVFIRTPDNTGNCTVNYISLTSE